MISVDPGVSYYAWAEWRLWDTGPVLHRAGINVIDVLVPGSSLVIEAQEIRKGSPVRSSDIIDLAFSAGRVADRYQEVVKYHYSEWAGSQSAKMVRDRTLKALTPEERALIIRHSKKDQAHIVEAVGLGLYHLRRKGLRNVQNQEG